MRLLGRSLSKVAAAWYQVLAAVVVPANSLPLPLPPPALPM